MAGSGKGATLSVTATYQNPSSAVPKFVKVSGYIFEKEA